MSNKNTQEDFIIPYAAFMTITGTALFVGSLLSLVEQPDEISTKAYYKFTAVCAGLFGTGLLGGLLWQKKEDKKAKSFTERIEQEQAAKSAASPAPADRSV